MTAMTEDEALADDQMRGRCEECGEETVIFRDNHRCDECDSDSVECKVCGEWQHIDDLCRHVFRDEGFEWCGAGVGAPRDDSIKVALFKLFDLMPEGFAPDLRVAIESGRFHTWLMAPMIGGGGALSLFGMPDRDGRVMISAWGDSLIEIGEGERAKETGDGYRWLVSLYDEQTPAANRLTVTWIDEWLTARGLAGGPDR